MADQQVEKRVDPKAVCRCGHTAHWHGQESGTPQGSGACDSCGCERFTPERVDHAAEACRLLQPRADGSLPRVDETDTAQVHATLALHEQLERLVGRAPDADWEAAKWRITSDAHCSVLMRAEDAGLDRFDGLDVADKAETLCRLLAEFDAWLSMRGEFSEALAAFREAFGNNQPQQEDTPARD